jgi:hypothetical protein
MANNLLIIYKEYLVKVASRECRPFRLPKNLNSLEKRNDYSFFLVLEKKLSENGIKSKYQITKFMTISDEYLQEFHISDIVLKFDEILEEYKNHKEETDEEYRLRIKKSFDKLAEYCIMNGINNIEDLNMGSPSVLLKLWKGGKIDDVVVIKLFDLSRISKKSWAKAYCGDLLNSFRKKQAEIQNGIHSSFLEHERVKFNKTINN